MTSRVLRALLLVVPTVIKYFPEGRVKKSHYLKHKQKRITYKIELIILALQRFYSTTEPYLYINVRQN